MTTTRRIVDISTHDLPAGYEASETSEAKAVAFDHLEGVYISDSGEAITAADRVVEALIEAGWRPTVEAPAAERHEPSNADAPTDAEIEAAARAVYETRDDPYDDTEWGELTSVDRERWECYARVALPAAREVSGR